MKVTKSVTDSFNLCIEKVVTTIEEKMSLRLDVMARDIFLINQKMDVLEKQNRDLQLENESLKSSMRLINTRITTVGEAVEEQDQYSRNDNILLHGVPLPADGSKELDLTKTVIDVLKRNMPDVLLHPENISTAHRLPLRSQPSSGSNQKPPPIIIRFAHRSVKNSVLSGRRVLKGKGISLSEHLTLQRTQLLHLTLQRTQLLHKAIDLVSQNKILGTWTNEGKIIVKARDSRTSVISSELDLLKFN
jgi:hypothetical protein